MADGSMLVVPGVIPGAVGGCYAKTGSVCYYCEYSRGGGYSVCGENASGSVSLCIDYQDLPNLPEF